MILDGTLSDGVLTTSFETMNASQRTGGAAAFVAVLSLHSVRLCFSAAALAA